MPTVTNRSNRKKPSVSVQHRAIKGLHVRIQILTCYESFVPTHDQPFAVGENSNSCRVQTYNIFFTFQPAISVVPKVETQSQYALLSKQVQMYMGNSFDKRLKHEKPFFLFSES